MQWFLKEQVEEVASMTHAARPSRDRAGSNLFDLEDFVAREMSSPKRRAGRTVRRGRARSRPGRAGPGSRPVATPAVAFQRSGSTSARHSASRAPAKAWSGGGA